MMQTPMLKLNDGNQIPEVGFSLKSKNKDVYEKVTAALNNGFSLLDIEEDCDLKEVGRAIKDSKIARDQIFISLKLAVNHTSFNQADKAIKKDLLELGTDYVDMIVLSQPYGDVYGAWNAMSAAKRKGETKSIGLGNFYPDEYMNLELAHEDYPALNQIEISPFFQQTNDVKFFQGRNVAVQAWGILGKDDQILKNSKLESLATKYHKSVKQIVIRWLIQHSILTLTEDTNPNILNVFDFELDTDDMEIFKELDQGFSQFYDQRDPAVIDDIWGESLKQLRHS